MFEFDTIGFQLLGVPSYFCFALLGFVIAICVYIILIASKNFEVTKYTKILFPSFIGLAIGSRLFGMLTGIYRSIGNNTKITLDSILDTGIVFYGGLIGFLIAYFLCLQSRHFHLDGQAINILAVCIPLFHTFARIGCFTSGCCYGRLYTGILSVKYTTYIENSININLRFPVQLLESLFDLGLFVYLLTLLRSKEWRSKNILIRYLTIYSIGRFFLEYLRGDIRRGIVDGLSFSQTVSIFLWLMLLGYALLQRKRKLSINK